MVGALNRTTKQGLKDLFLGFVVNNPHAMVAALNQLGFIGEGANLTAIERGVRMMMDQYHGMTLGEARELNVREVAHEMEDLFYRQPFRIPAQFAFAGRAIGTLSGLATGLAPEFNVVAVGIPYAQRFLGLSRDGATQSAQQLFTQMLDAGRTLLVLPATMERVLSKIEAGQIEVNVSEDGRSPRSRRAGGRAARGANTLIGLIVLVAGLAAGVLLLLNALTVPGWFCVGLGAIAALRLLFAR
jgi:predicted unusual protein kinase regulating ubiquinone biosynthesis (AarF/ABC1/UbiB family)